MKRVIAELRVIVPAAPAPASAQAVPEPAPAPEVLPVDGAQPADAPAEAPGAPEATKPEQAPAAPAPPPVVNEATILLPAIPVSIVLNDLSAAGLGLFSRMNFPIGQDVSIIIKDPKSIVVKGKVAWTQECSNDSHILSEMQFNYRVGVEFVFATAEESEAMKTYVNEIFRDFVQTKRVA